MVIYRSLSDAVPISGSVVTMGTFDGLHRGHQEIVKQVVVNAKSKNVPSVLITFDPHPRHVLDKDRDKLSLIMNLDAKISILKKYQVDTVLIIPFTQDFSQLPAKEFLEEVVINYFHRRSYFGIHYNFSCKIHFITIFIFHRTIINSHPVSR